MARRFQKALFICTLTLFGIVIQAYLPYQMITKKLIMPFDQHPVRNYDVRWKGVPASIHLNSDKSLEFRYKYQHIYGKALKLSTELMKSLSLPPKTYYSVSEHNKLPQVVFVTVADYVHARYMEDGISTIQTFGKGSKIVVWDIGMRAAQVKKIKSLCDVEYRLFNFSKYPPYVRRLKNYAFKAIMIMETLKDYDYIFYFDSSIRFINTTDFSHTYHQFNQTKGFLQLGRAVYPTYTTTNKSVYTFFPSNINKLKETEMGASGLLLILKTEEVFKNIILFWFLCSLNIECQAPCNLKSCLKCNMTKVKRGEYGGCHRYDQSTLAILLGNYYNFNYKLYIDYMAKNDEGDFLRIMRGKYSNLTLDICKNKDIL